jgi:hypothetical protein
LCSSIDDFASSVGALGSSRSRAEVESNAQEVKASGQKLRASAGEARTAGAQSVEDAVDAFTAALDDALASDSPVTQVTRLIADTVAHLDDRLTEARGAAGCDGSPAATPATSSTPPG